jgi:hypothetical protein
MAHASRIKRDTGSPKSERVETLMQLVKLITTFMANSNMRPRDELACCQLRRAKLVKVESCPSQRLAGQEDTGRGGFIYQMTYDRPRWSSG